MLIHPLKVTSTLADKTRYQIYEYMLQQKKYFTVQDIATQFDIHPNVSRLHLTKLAEINLITADYVKTGKGGRPGRVYKASEEGIVLSFPKRDEGHLLKWTLQIIKDYGSEALEKAKAISYQDGFENVKETFIKEKITKNSLDFNNKLNILANASSMIGYFPQISETDQGKKIIFTIYNCPFRNQIQEYNEIVCALHEAYLQGQIDALFSENELLQTESMVHDCELCQYKILIQEPSLL
ncbi:transcriptional regulator [Ureibacillus composti]|nr:transcriptional regulator [Ureibacillus composti]